MNNKDIKSLKRQLMAAVAMCLAAAVALGSSTYAWFVSNTQVRAELSSVTAASATANLMIVPGTTASGGSSVASITSSSATALYPASTDDCNSWWVVNAWEDVSGNTKASGYYKPDITLTGNDDNVKNGVYNTNVNAYQVSTFTIYTTAGTVDLCLAENSDSNPAISVAKINENSTDNTGFSKAMRVGIVVDNTLKVVYAPVDETGTGNDKDGQSGWRAVNDQSSTKNVTYKHIAGTNFIDWAATTNNGELTAATNKLATGVNSNGVTVKVYIWLEGTDAECLVGTADALTDGNTYKVTINFAGIPVTTGGGSGV